MTPHAAGSSDYEACASIKNAVDPDDPVTPGQLAEARGTLLLHGRDGFAFVDRSSLPRSAYAMRAVNERLGYRLLSESIVVHGWPR